MRSACPGQDFRNLRVELFSNETKVKCHGCGEWICEEKLPSCIDWCASARQWMGEERWNGLKGCE